MGNWGVRLGNLSRSLKVQKSREMGQLLQGNTEQCLKERTWDLEHIIP
jgi:hypothetical protein